MALIDIDELQDVVTLALALILKLLVSVSKIRNDVCLLSVLLLELLAAAKQLFIHRRKPAEFELHLLPCFPESCLSVLFALIELDGDLLQSTMHLLDSLLVLLEDLNGFPVFQRTGLFHMFNLCGDLGL